ncbi:MAG TPA: tetratricopeptide repeat protein [Terriglobales bacterium]|nr:tetratricopeptide repeat protein [Terriglobales bacterium]
MIALVTTAFAVALMAAPFHTAAHKTASAEAGGTETGSASFSQVSQAAGRARNQGHLSDAIRLYSQALRIKPDWKEGLWYLGAALYDDKQFAQARNVLRRFVAYDPEPGLGWALLGMSEFQTRQYSRSLDHLQRAMAQGMRDQKDLAQSVFYTAAVLLTRFEHYDDSMGLLLALVKSGQPAGPLTEAVGLAALRMPYLPAEIPSDRHDLVNMAGEGTLAIEAQHRDDAERLFREMVAAYPGDPGTHFLYGAYLLGVRPEDGVRELKKELEVSPSNIPARLRLTEEYVKEQQLDLALPLAQQAVKLDRKRAPAHMMLGEVLVAKGDLDAGIRELETAREEEPQTVRIRWDLMRAYLSAGRGQDAAREKEEIEKLSQSGPGE